MRKRIYHALAGISLLIGLTQCQKSTLPTEVKPEHTIPNALASVRKEIMQEVLTAAKKQEFRSFVLEECIKQKNGDYTVYLKDIAAAFRGKPGYEKLVSSLETLIQKSKQITSGEPLIFYPRAETIEEKRLLQGNTRDQFGEPEGPAVLTVYQDVFNWDYSSPGYILNDGYMLVYYQDISEDYAWENDVWVIGEEETVSPDNMLSALEDYTLNPGRINGEAEYGGIIQLTDMNALEHWTSGKFEFRYVVNNAGGTIIKDRAFGKIKRKYFRDSKWYDTNDFIANWNVQNVGNWMIEGWIEEDGGNSTSTVSQTFPAPCTGCPSTSVSYTKQNRDQDMGRTLIQFTDNKSQVYNISYANVKRR